MCTAGTKWLTQNCACYIMPQFKLLHVTSNTAMQERGSMYHMRKKEGAEQSNEKQTQEQAAEMQARTRTPGALYPTQTQQHPSNPPPNYRPAAAAWLPPCPQCPIAHSRFPMHEAQPGPGSAVQAASSTARGMVQASPGDTSTATRPFSLATLSQVPTP